MSRFKPGGIDGVHGPILDPTAIQALDRHLIEDLGIPGIVLMEHAAIGVASLVRRIASEHGRNRVIVLCGTGNNGGDGWAVARLLHREFDLLVVSAGDSRPGSDAAVNASAARGLQIDSIGIAESRTIEKLLSESVVVDALLGVGLDRPLQGDLAELVGMVGRSEAVVVAIDIPSGLDATTGIPTGPVIKAHATATMAAFKPGLVAIGADSITGPITIVDIGAPRTALERFLHVARSPRTGDDVDSSI